MRGSTLVDNRGAAVLLVDNTFSTNLATELQRLTRLGWGWVDGVASRRGADDGRPGGHQCKRSDRPLNELASIKGLITADYNGDPTNVNTVFIFGYVPVPYSGDISPDENPDHVGAWPANVFYANLTGARTDSSVW